MTDVDTRVLRYYLAVAEHSSFTRAAERLYVSQPSLSRQIQRLEEDLGIRLFERTSRGVRLTAAGEALLPSARQTVEDWRRAVRDVRTAAAAGSRLLRIGFVATGAGAFGRRVRDVHAARRPDVTLEPKRFDWGGEAEALRQGLADVAFLWLPTDLSGLRTEVVAEEPRWVAVARTHALAGRADVGIREVADEPVVWTRKAPQQWVDWWAVNPRPDGSAPRWGPENDNVEEMLEHVATGSAICFGTESMARYYAHPDLVWRRVRDIEPLRIAVAWPGEKPSPLVRDFLATVRELAAENGTNGGEDGGEAGNGRTGKPPA
ncbi:LysR family transcriptional regulator [Streptomyces beigongshangae]|uniref:LysR family transcriptional regulator n=1 Tax=Streptomyces beigongshangae TaxID=2841597 RepID=UPI0027E17FC6|nr:LysR family transcriptional regulator [Streptomyces sp. REN17]